MSILLFNASTHMLLHGSRHRSSGGGSVTGFEFLMIIIVSVLAMIWILEIMTAFMNLGFNEYKKKSEFFMDLIPFKQSSCWFYKKISKLD